MSDLVTLPEGLREGLRVAEAHWEEEGLRAPEAEPLTLPEVLGVGEAEAAEEGEGKEVSVAALEREAEGQALGEREPLAVGGEEKDTLRLPERQAVALEEGLA